MTKEEEKKRNDAKKKMIEEVKKVGELIRDTCEKLNSDFHIYSCPSKTNLQKIKSELEQIKAKYAEHKFDYSRYMPHVDERDYKYIRLRSEMTFNTRDFLNGTKIKLLECASQQEAEALKSKVMEGFKSDTDKNLFINDLHGLQYYIEEVESKDGNVSYTSGLIASNCNFIQRFHSGYHLLAYARENDTSPQEKFRANCVIGHVEHCSRVNERAIMQRNDRRELTAIFVWEFHNRHKLKRIEFYPSDKIIEAQDEIDIII